MSASLAETETKTSAWAEMTAANCGTDAFEMLKNPKIEVVRVKENAQTKGNSASNRTLHASVDGTASAFCSGSFEEIQESLMQNSEHPSSTSSSRATSRCDSNNQSTSSRGISMFAKGVQLPRCSFSFRQMNKKGEVSATEWPRMPSICVRLSDRSAAPSTPSDTSHSLHVVSHTSGPCSSRTKPSLPPQSGSLQQASTCTSMRSSMDTEATKRRSSAGKTW